MSSSRLCYFAVLLPLAVACGKGDALNSPGDPLGTDLPARPVSLTIETPTSMLLGLEEPASILARVTYSDDGSPAGDRPVAFAISGNSGGASLAASQVLTGSDGRALNQLTTGVNRTSFQVVVTTAQAPGYGDNPRAVINVEVDGVYRGKLKVRFVYDEPVVLDTIVTRVHQGALDCAGVNWPTQPPGVATQNAAGVFDSPVFDGLTEGQVYTVTASGIGIAGEQVAVGCAVAPAIVGRSVITLNLPLDLRPVQIVGTYDFGTQLHLTDALPGTVGSVIGELQQFFLDPANYVAQELIKGLASVLGISETASKTTLETAWFAYASANSINPNADNDALYLDDAINYFALSRAPQWVRDGFMVGADLTSLLTDFTVGGKLAITDVNDMGDFTAHWDYSNFLFTWRAGADCNLSDACCGRTEYSGHEMGLSPVGADFTGSLTRNTAVTTRIEYNFEMNEHRLNIQYGNIALFAVEKILLPAITGQDSIQCAVESFFGCQNSNANFVCGGASLNDDVCGCDRFGAWLTGLLSSVIAVDASVGSAACDLAVVGAANYARNLLLSLTWGGTNDGYLLMSASGTMADADYNLSTDLIDAGSTGTLNVGSYSTAFSGEITGDTERVACAADSGCQSFEACQVKADVLDDCAGRQVCVQRLGTRNGGESCTLATQCKSGQCMANFKCLSVCDSNDDCSSGLSCGTQPVQVPISTERSVPVRACGI